MDDAAIMGILHGIANVDQPPQQLAQIGAAVLVGSGGGVIFFNGLLQTVAADEAHGIKRTAIGVDPQTVHRNDAGVLQPAGNLGFEHEASPAAGIVGAMGLDLFQGHFAVKLAVVGQENLA